MGANLSYSIDSRARLVLFHYAGSADFSEWAAVMQSLLSDPEYRPGFGFLTDRRSQIEIPSTAFVRSVIDFLHRNGEAIGVKRWATVVGSPAGYGMGRMAQQLGHELPFEIEIFSDVETARSWLNEENRP
jgi:hypothetical protein